MPSLIPSDYQVSPEDTPTAPALKGPCLLYLQNCAIFAADAPETLLYEVSHPPCEAKSAIYGIQKAKFSNSTNDKSKISRLSHIYDVRDPDFLQNHRNPVLIEGKGGPRKSYKELTMSRGIGGWSSCKIDGYFSASKDGLDCIVWSDATGLQLARETPAQRRDDNSTESPPQLSIETMLPEKDFDLLVACWIARLWKEAQKESHNWKKGIMNTFGVAKRSDDKERQNHQNNANEGGAWNALDAGVAAAGVYLNVDFGMRMINKIFQS